MTLILATVRAYDAITDTVSIEIAGPRITYLAGIARAAHIDPSLYIMAGTRCIVAMPDDTNPTEALVIATYP